MDYRFSAFQLQGSPERERCWTEGGAGCAFRGIVLDPEAELHPAPCTSRRMYPRLRTLPPPFIPFFPVAAAFSFPPARFLPAPPRLALARPPPPLALFDHSRPHQALLFQCSMYVYFILHLPSFCMSRDCWGDALAFLLLSGCARVRCRELGTRV